MPTHRFCDGVTRRDFLHIGGIGASGLCLADYLRLADDGQVQRTRATSAVFVFLGGGPGHLDTFDMKPRRASRDSGRVSAHRHERCGHSNLRTSAPPRPNRRQLRHPSRRQSHVGRTRLGNGLHEHRKQAVAFAYLSRRRRRRREGDSRRARTAPFLLPSPTPRSALDTSAFVMPRWPRTACRGRASRSACEASR